MFKLDKNGLMTDIDCYVSNLENKINNLQSKIDKIEKILKYDGIVEDIYYALCMLFGFEYYDDETMIDKELRNILKENK